LLLLAIAAGAYFWSNRPRGFNLQNMKIVQVTSTGNAGAAALSPDRRYIVYVLRDGAQESLWVQQLATGSNIQILAPDQVHFVAVSFTPDGNYVMFVRSDKSTVNFRYLYQIPALGGTPKQLIRDVDCAPAFSPDGQEIAFVRGGLNPSGNAIVIAKADGSDERVLFHRASINAGQATVSWSPDGRTLAIISAENRGNTSPWVLEAVSRKSGEERDLHSFPLPSLATAWLPDGSGLLVTSADPQSGSGQIWHVSYPKGEVSRFTNDLTNYSQCCLEITRDGDALVALQSTTLSDVWLAKADGSDAKQITSGEEVGFGLDWVGDRIAAQNGRAQWALLNSDGTTNTAITNDHDPHFQLSACNDGRHLVYSTWRNGMVELWRSDGDGANPMRLTPHSVLGGGVCAPDSKSALYVVDGGVWRVSLDGGNPEKTDLPFSQIGYSLDGKLFFNVTQTVENGNMRSIFQVQASEAKTPLYTFDVPYGMQSPQFAPDGKAMAFILTRNHAGNVWEQPLTGGDLVQLTKFTNGEMFSFSWSKDGKRLAFSRGVRKTDVLMMSNFR
jgi:Tol biopolymer transport system component